jgi:zinc transport system substrate-binding protein
MRTICNYTDQTVVWPRILWRSRRLLSCGGHALIALACLLSWIAGAQEPLRITTTFFPIYSIASSVAGRHVQVDNLLPAGVSPHEFQLSPKDLKKLSQAGVIVMNGLGLESWIEAALEKVEVTKPQTLVRLADGLKDQLISEAASHAHGVASAHPAFGAKDIERAQANPHIWLDPVLMAHGASNVLSVLVRLDPAHADDYRKNTEALVGRLRQLDMDYRQTLQAVRHGAFITYHQAFPYLVRRYELRQAGVFEEVPDVEPSARHLAELARVIREQKVKVIFIEPTSSPKLALQLAQDCGIKVAELDTLETGPLTAMGYEEKMRQNLASLVRGLQ